jgi:antitoxin CptB
MMMPEADTLDARRRRLIWRATHRGMKEMDLVLGGFARRRLPHMTEEEVTEFEALLDETDADLHDWLVKCLTPPSSLSHPLIEALRKTRYIPDDYGNI